MKENTLSKLENKFYNETNERLVNVLVFLTGLVSAVIGMLPLIDGTLSVVLISVGASLIASSIVSYLTSIYIFGMKKEKKITEYWGLNAIYETRQRMNDSCDIATNAAENNLDIVAFGLRSFRDAKTDLISEKVKKGMKVRILTIHPDSEFLKQRERDEKKNEGDIRKTIIDLYEWVEELSNIAPKKENVSIKFYDALPLDFYFRVDGTLFIGQYLYKIDSQQTISFEFRDNAKGFDYYTKYFESILWSDKHLPKKIFENK